MDVDYAKKLFPNDFIVIQNDENQPVNIEFTGKSLQYISTQGFGFVFFPESLDINDFKLMSIDRHGVVIIDNNKLTNFIKSKLENSTLDNAIDCAKKLIHIESEKISNAMEIVCEQLHMTNSGKEVDENTDFHSCAHIWVAGQSKHVSIRVSIGQNYFCPKNIKNTNKNKICLQFFTIETHQVIKEIAFAIDEYIINRMNDGKNPKDIIKEVKEKILSDTDTILNIIHN